ncbi:hypothetical protein Sjap_020037 [Stephania japonica]|uniref:Uncharacterized protein n=1 Tax=Stephania japonica TaxID=461633 RepID=A0AAP0F586_9MAGN
MVMRTWLRTREERGGQREEENRVDEEEDQEEEKEMARAREIGDGELAMPSPKLSKMLPRTPPSLTLMASSKQVASWLLNPMAWLTMSLAERLECSNTHDDAHLNFLKIEQSEKEITNQGHKKRVRDSSKCVLVGLQDVLSLYGVFNIDDTGGHRKHVRDSLSAYKLDYN